MKVMIFIVHLCLQIVIPFLITVVLLKSNLIVTYIIAFASGVSIAAAFLLPWWVQVSKRSTDSDLDWSCELMCMCVCRSMLPDVVDDFKVLNPESQGHEAIFYSFYVFFTKFASGVSLGVSTLSLEWVSVHNHLSLTIPVNIFCLHVFMGFYRKIKQMEKAFMSHSVWQSVQFSFWQFTLVLTYNLFLARKRPALAFRACINIQTPRISLPK